MEGHSPTYIPDTSGCPEKLDKHAHESTLHGKVGLTMTMMREQYRIPRLRGLAKRLMTLINRCAGLKQFQAVAVACSPPSRPHRQDCYQGAEPKE